MAVYDGCWIYKGLEVTCWMDPNRYRVMIWKDTPRPVLVKRMHGKDRKQLLLRAKTWLDKQ